MSMYGVSTEVSMLPSLKTSLHLHWSKVPVL